MHFALLHIEDVLSSSFTGNIENCNSLDLLLTAFPKIAFPCCIQNATAKDY